MLVIKMKRVLVYLLCLSLLPLLGCVNKADKVDIVATTLPVWEFTQRLCKGTELRVERLVTEDVACLHDYTLKTEQMRLLESADLIIINGAGLEEFLKDALLGRNAVDASRGISLAACEHHPGEHDGHTHDEDPHIWLSPVNARHMSENIYAGLCLKYPQYIDNFEANLADLTRDLDALQAYGELQLQDLSCRELLTFHDGFHYLADSFGLSVVETVEEESGSEASAQTLIHLIGVVNNHYLPSIFTDTNGSISAAQVISRETGATIYTLDMAMAGNSYFDAMYQNIDTLKEALQ